jgi:hypothetical protein
MEGTSYFLCLPKTMMIVFAGHARMVKGAGNVPERRIRKLIGANWGKEMDGKSKEWHWRGRTFLNNVWGHYWVGMCALKTRARTVRVPARIFSGNRLGFDLDYPNRNSTEEFLKFSG